MTHDAFLQACVGAIGATHVLTAPEDQAPYLTDWRKRFTGRARAVLRPASPDEVATLVRLCGEYGAPIVPQGGNTGLCGGATPDMEGNAVVISLQRMQRVRAVDSINNTITVDAGCILANVQQAAADADRLFPLSLAAEGSCTIGGNLATNAGGTAVLRYGNARELCLGIEAVLPNGELWNGLRGLRKDNTGYDLRDLLIGAEGTLGIITGAMLKLFPQPRAKVTALAALQSPRQALAFLSLAQGHAGTLLTGFELMSAFCLELVRKHYPQLRVPFTQAYPQYVLLELSDLESEAHARTLFESLMEDALARGVIDDAAVAESVAQSRDFWSLREHIPLAQADEGKNIKHDIGVPISRIADFIDVTDRALAAAYPSIRMVTFGHLGDGNLHYNVSPPEGVADTDFIAQQAAINLVVHDSVDRFGGSISAEHGLGALKREEIRRYKSPVELQMMRAIKLALDPQQLMNPGKVL